MEIKNNKTSLMLYSRLLSDIKARIRQAQVKATLSANAEMITMYWDIGRMIHKRQREEGWGAGVIPRLAKDIQNELSEIKGFSERNIKFMVQLYKEYETDVAIGKQPVSQLENVKQVVSQLPWGHNILLMQRIKDIDVRIWYMEQTIQNGWSRDTLALMIKSSVYERQGKSISNFRFTLPDPQSDLARRFLKDPYIFDFFVRRENCITYWCKSSRGNSAVHPCSLREASGETRSVKFSDKVSIREMSNPAGCSVSEPISSLVTK